MDIKTSLGHEIERNKELLQIYQDIGSAGIFGSAMIKSNIKEAEQAMSNDDVVAIVRCLATLKENK